MSAGGYGLHLENSGRYGENKEWGVRFDGAIGATAKAFFNQQQTTGGPVSVRWGSFIAASARGGSSMPFRK